MGFVFDATRLYAVLALAGFVAAAAFLTHRFWREREREGRMHEALQFSRNARIFVELVHIELAQGRAHARIAPSPPATDRL